MGARNIDRPRDMQMRTSALRLANCLVLLTLASLLVGCGESTNRSTSNANGRASDDELSCAAEKGATKIAAARLFIEHNATDQDTGLQGEFDDEGYSELCVFDPNGKQVLAIKPRGELKKLTMADSFFESREPENSEISIDELLANFPEGEYEVRALSFEGKGLRGSAMFTHDIPAKPKIVTPALSTEEEVAKAPAIATSDVTVTWEDVTETLKGERIDITGYEIIVTKHVEEDPNGLSLPVYDVHVPADRNSLPVPVEFFESNTEYELEILALEKSGNQTISSGFFKTK